MPAADRTLAEPNLSLELKQLASCFTSSPTSFPPLLALLRETHETTSTSSSPCVQLLLAVALSAKFYRRTKIKRYTGGFVAEEVALPARNSNNSENLLQFGRRRQRQWVTTEPLAGKKNKNWSCGMYFSSPHLRNRQRHFVFCQLGLHF